MGAVRRLVEAADLVIVDKDKDKDNDRDSGRRDVGRVRRRAGGCAAK
jgi:hypothetical protein